MSLSGLVDLHCHLLPGVDDGPATLEESLAYAAHAVAAGTSTIVATPHVERVDVRELPDRVHELRAALGREGIPLRVACGGELKPRSVPELGDEELETIAHGPPGARWVLLEVPFRGVTEELEAAVEELRTRGFGALLAHPERAKGFDDELPRLRRLLRGGAAAQMNVGPLSGRESPERERAARALLELRIASAMATDAHAPSRPYTLADGAAIALRRGADAREARRLVVHGPRALLAAGLRSPSSHRSSVS